MTTGGIVVSPAHYGHPSFVLAGTNQLIQLDTLILASLYIDPLFPEYQILLLADKISSQMSEKDLLLEITNYKNLPLNSRWGLFWSDWREGAVFLWLISGGNRRSRLRDNAEGARIPRR